MAKFKPGDTVVAINSFLTNTKKVVGANFHMLKAIADGKVLVVKDYHPNYTDCFRDKRDNWTYHEDDFKLAKDDKKTIPIEILPIKELHLAKCEWEYGGEWIPATIYYSNGSVFLIQDKMDGAAPEDSEWHKYGSGSWYDRVCEPDEVWKSSQRIRNIVLSNPPAYSGGLLEHLTSTTQPNYNDSVYTDPVTFALSDNKQTNKKKGIIMSLITKLKKLTRKEPEKSFINTGVTVESGELTEEGRNAFIQFLFDKEENRTAFYNEVVKPIVDAEKEEKS